MSALDAGARTAAVSWRDALDCIAVDGRCISAQEVSDFCSVLFLAERVHVVARRRSEPAASLLTTQLTTLGYPVHGADRLGAVEATDTVVTIQEPGHHDRQPWTLPLLGPAAESGAVLLAIAAGDCSRLLTRADAAITIPVPRPRGRTDDSRLARVIFDLLVSLTVNVIARDLAGRIISRNDHPTTDHQPLPAVNPADKSALDAAGADGARILRLGPHRPLRRCRADGRNRS